MESKSEKVIFHNAQPGEYTLVYREGNAPPVKVLNPQIIKQNGVIKAPLEFYQVRKGMRGVLGSEYFPKQFTHVLVNREAGTIQLVWGEHAEEQSNILGKIEVAEQYRELKLNAGGAYTSTPKELANLLKRYRYLFTDQSEGMKVIADLLTFKAEVKSNIVAEQDNRGNKKNLVETSIESNVPIQFNMKLELFKGFQKEKVEVNICFQAVSATSVECWLESIAALEWFDKQRQELFDKELQPFKEDGIAVIEC